MVVPEGVAVFTCNSSVKFAVPLTARLPLSVQVMVPVPPISAGKVPHVHPAGGVIDWKFVFGGVVCGEKVIPAAAAAGPLFVTLCV